MDGFDISAYGEELKDGAVLVWSPILADNLLERYKDEIESIFTGPLKPPIKSWVGMERDINLATMTVDSNNSVLSLKFSHKTGSGFEILTPVLADEQMFAVTRVFHILTAMYELEVFDGCCIIPRELEVQKNSLRHKFGNIIYLDSDDFECCFMASTNTEARARISNIKCSDDIRDIKSSYRYRYRIHVPSDNKPFPKVVVSGCNSDSL